MKAVILCAGEGTRMRPLTRDTPKPLLPVAGKPIVEHNMEVLRGEVEDIILVTGYRAEQFNALYGGEEDVEIVRQDEALGTGHAALQAQILVEEDALILNGDDIYGDQLLEMLEKDDAVLVSEVEEPSSYGVFEIQDGSVSGIFEKPEEPPSNLANAGCYRVDSRFFELLEGLELSERGEYEITEAVQKYLKERSLEPVTAERWLPCSYPWQLLEASERLLRGIEGRTDGDVHEEAELSGEVVVEEGAEIRRGARVEGPTIVRSGVEVGINSQVGSFTVLGRRAVVGRGSSVEDTVLRRDAKLLGDNVVKSSYLGKASELGERTRTVTESGEGEIDMYVKGEVVDTGRQVLGCFVGSNAEIGNDCNILPGRKVGFGAAVESGETVREDVGSENLPKVGIDFDRVLFDTDAFSEALRERFDIGSTPDKAYVDGLYDPLLHADYYGIDCEEFLEFARENIDRFMLDGLEILSTLDAVVVTRGLDWWQRMKVERSRTLDYIDGLVVIESSDMEFESKQVAGIDLLVDDSENELENVDIPTMLFDDTEHGLEHIFRRAEELRER